MEVGLIFGALILLLAVRVPVAAAMAGMGLFLFVAEGVPLTDIPVRLSRGLDSFDLLCVPFFLVLSSLLLKADIARDLYRAARSLVGQQTGGLAVTTLLSCVIFSALTGSSVAAVASIGALAVPELTERGYPRVFVLGLLGMGGALGILFPPSIALIVFGVVTDTSVQALLLAGFAPGLLLFALAWAACFFYARSQTRCLPASPDAPGERQQNFAAATPVLCLALGIAVAFYAGLPAPLIAAISLLAVWVRIVRSASLPREKIIEALESGMRATLMVYLVIIGANVFGQASLLAGLPGDISSAVEALALTPSSFILMLAAVLLLVGFFLEVLPMVVLLAPILLATLQLLGIDPVWFGVFFVLLVEVALILPPFGLNLYVIQAVGRSSADEMGRGVLPFVMLLLCGSLLLWLWPGLATAIPAMLQVG